MSDQRIDLGLGWTIEPYKGVATCRERERGPFVEFVRCQQRAVFVMCDARRPGYRHHLCADHAEIRKAYLEPVPGGDV